MTPPQPTTTIAELLCDSPKNWGRWGAEDEIGALNVLTAPQVLRGVARVRQGTVFTLQLPMMSEGGDPTFPGRQPPQHFVTFDKSRFISGKKTPEIPGGLQAADDVAITPLHGTTHCDALGHAWVGDEIYNGFDARTTIGGLARASILPIASHGIVGSGILLDIARWRGKDALDPGETFTHEDLIECASAQGTEICPRDILVIRTGWIPRFYTEGKESFSADLYREPGLTYSPELVDWFHAMDIPSTVTDTFGNEVMIDPVTGLFQPLHIALLSYLGVVLTELAWLEDLARDCKDDGQYEFLYAAAPLKVDGGSGAPVNPIAVK